MGNRQNASRRAVPVGALGTFKFQSLKGLALAGFKFALRLIDDVDTTATAHQSIGTVPSQQRLQ